MTHFTTLGLANTASATDIRRAFHRLAQELHPDRATGSSLDPERSARFAEVTAAYNALKTPERLEAYRRTLFGENDLAPDDIPIIDPATVATEDRPTGSRLILGLRAPGPDGLGIGALSVRVPVYHRDRGDLVRRGSRVLPFRIAQPIPVGEVQDYPPMPLFPIVDGENWHLRIVVLPDVGPIPDSMLPHIEPEPAATSDCGRLGRWFRRR